MNKQEYKQKLKEWNEPSIWSLKEEIIIFKCNMNINDKIIFNYLIKKLEENLIIYRFLSEFYIIQDNIYFELYADLSFIFEREGENQEFGKIKNKKDVDKIINILI